MADYLTTDTELKSIADAIRTKGGTSDSLVYPDGFVTAIGNISGGGGEAKEWVRPSTWPDLDSLDLSNEDAMYYTVDCRSAIAVHELDPDAECTIGFCADTTGGTWTLERGKVENGTFVVTETCVANRNSGAYFDTVIPITEGDFVVYRMRATGDAAEGKGLKLVETCSASHEKPVVEIYGRLPWATGNVSRKWGYREFASRITEHVKVIFPSTSTITDLARMFYGCSSLQSVDMSGWDTTNWAVTNLGNMFNDCYSLQSVDMSGWDTTNWAVTNLNYMFNGCYSLQVLKFGAKTVWPALATQINNTSSLRHNSIVALFNALPTVTTSVTLTLGKNNLARVSDDEIAIATGKGWTVA